MEIWRVRGGTIEVDELLNFRAWPVLLIILLTLAVRGVFGKPAVRLVFYAIYNGDPVKHLASYLLNSAFISRAVLTGLGRFVYPKFDRIAFGTKSAAEAYSSAFQEEPILKRLFWAVPTPCSSCAHTEKSGVLFVGALDERKGIDRLLAAWSRIVTTIPDGSLTVLGTGELSSLVRAAVTNESSVSFVEAPSRRQIHSALAKAKVLVLLSQPTTRWREQVGLPILEALAHGCEVVTTTETGLAPWLEQQGHQVLLPSATSDEIAAAVVRGINSQRHPNDILRALPQTDGREAAANWLRGS